MLLLGHALLVDNCQILLLSCLLLYFFFSSRRRHTRFDCDWSSDVCSSDLRAFGLQRGMDHAGGVVGPILAWWLLAPGGGSASVRAVIAWSIVPGVAVLVLASWAVRDGGGRGRLGEVGEVRGGSERAGQPSLTSSNLPRPSPISPLLGISAFYLLRMPDTLIILRSQELGVPVAIVDRKSTRLNSSHSQISY